MKRKNIKLGGIILGGVAILIGLAGCGGGSSTAPAAQGKVAIPVTPIPAPPQTTPAVTTAANSTSAPEPTVTPSPATPAAGASSDELLALGKLVYDKKAGGVGCAYCHGLDGRGQGISGENGPNIRGAPKFRVQAAVTGGVSAMNFIKLTDEEITAVTQYLQYLAQQP